MNIGSELRQLWETVLASDGEDVAADALYSRVGKILKDDLQIGGSAARLLG